MNPCRLPLLLLTLIPLAAVRPADSAWRLVETTDDLTGASDRRLILRSENWSAAASTATIVVACGDRIPSSEGRSLLSEPLLLAPPARSAHGGRKLSVTYRAYGEVRTVSFHPAELREALPQLTGCHFG